ncbi:MAG: hypothetical protein CL844_04800 [Crocinitomicaceae bacterium]|nr:hypothetical protein [Crocinitomicaceae bacterium]|tara:strand:+ start:36669 stop:37886 length:1218 start_codon:yes stop_codon:yes gene_type:complete
MNGQNVNIIGFCTLILTLFGTILFPPITVFSSFPKVEISDVTFILLTIHSLLFNFHKLVDTFIKYKIGFLFFLVWILVASISIIFNERFFEYRDWFEPIKYFKLFLILLYSLIYFKGRLPYIHKAIKIIFFLVLIFNFLHYFNVLFFNDYVEIFYAPKHHLDFFGINSIGEPSTRRMLGTLGNPNNNAILFLLFVIYFLTIVGSKIGENHIYVSISSIFVLACQSRTGFVTLLIIFSAYFIIQKTNWRQILFYIITITLGYIFLYFSGNIYIDSIVDFSLLESAKRGRFEQWGLIFNEMPGNWIMGHGVNKALLEEKNIYSESEYMLILFRYGIIGLFSYLLICFSILKTSLSSLISRGGMMMLGVFIILIVTGITNTPFHVVKLSVLIIFIFSISLILIDEKKV